MSDLQNFEFDADGNRVFDTPVIRFTFDDGEIICRYDNTLIRKYGDPQFNHVEWVDENGQRMGVRAVPEAIQKLEDIGFPSHFEPNIIHDDPTSYEWFVGMAMSDVNVETLTVPDSWGGIGYE